MNPLSPLVAETSWFAGFLNNQLVAEVSHLDDTVTLRNYDGNAIESIPVAVIHTLTLTPRFFRNQLVIETKVGRTISVKWLQRRQSQALHDAVQLRIAHHRQVEEKRLERQALNDAVQLRTARHRQQVEEKRLERQAAAHARELTAQITVWAERLKRLLPLNHYIRQSRADQANGLASQLTGQFNERIRRHLGVETSKALSWIEEVAELDTLRSLRDKSNRDFADRTVPSVQNATDGLLPNRLTDEQARAIATDEDVTLVLAGAGTGKTAVIIGKIAHLVRNLGVPPAAILALAFNRDAALEIKKRLPANLEGVNVSTFHSFGLKVISSVDKAPSISKMAPDNYAYNKAIDNILHDMMMNAELAEPVIALASTFSAEYRAPFDFDSQVAYQQYIIDNELRTLSGDLVKSFEELTLANFLTRNSIAFEYEKSYQFRTDTREHRQYRPDFYLPDYDTYIEHFALNRDGRPPPGWIGYAEGVAWKRKLHDKHQTRLIETYSWQHRDATLLTTLEEKLQSHKVAFSPVPMQELVHKLSQERLSWLSKLIGTFLHHVKSGDLSPKEIGRRARNSRDPRRTEHFLTLFGRVRREYQALLEADQAIDFHDLINQATGIIRKGDWHNPYQYVLIDEFQDISDGRMALARTLRQPDLAYFLVGDDWQSIYRFAGSHVGLIHHCDHHLGHTQRTNLTQTFRFGNGILKPSTVFIQRNPEQTKRSLRSRSQTSGQGITVIASTKVEDGLNQALLAIREIDDSTDKTVLVLGRYKAGQKVLGRLGRSYAQVKFSTVHSAKGREADYVIVLDLKDDRYGFPCRVEDDPILELVMPPTLGQPYPNAEERRLFYVALTRARKGAYLVADANRPSPFVRELVETCPEVRSQGDLSHRCPACRRGALIPSQSGKTLRCSIYPGCQHQAPRCPNCRSGHAILNPDRTSATCTNPDCHQPPKVCPRCQAGILVLRTRPRAFWACSQYVATPSCTYTARKKT